MFNYTDHRDVGLVIDKSPNASTLYFKDQGITFVRLNSKQVRAGGRKMSNHGKERGSNRVTATE